MASAKNEAKIQFRAETAEFQESIKQANSEMASLRAEMKLNEAQFQNTGDEAEYLSNKHDLLQQALEANQDKQEALTQKIEVAKDIYGENSSEVQNLERQLTNCQTEEQKLLTEVNNLNKGFEDQKNEVNESASAMDTFAQGMAGLGIADVAKEVAEAVYDMADAFSESMATIVEGTGATGEALDELSEAAKDAYSNVADKDQTLQGMSGILAEVNTRFGQTGDQASETSQKISTFAQHTDTDGVKAVDSLADVMKRWNIPAEDMDDLLDDLTTANQSCSLSVDEMTGYLTNNSVQFQELGYSTTDALALMISLADGGANVSTVMQGMKQAVSNLSEVTDDVPGTFQLAIDAIGECDSVSEALNAQVGDTGLTVKDVFGARAAQEIATNIQTGNFAIEDWTEVLEDNQGALETTAEDATTMGDSVSQALENVKMTVGEAFAPAIETAVTAVADAITVAAQWVDEHPAAQAAIAAITAGLIGLAAALGIAGLITAISAAFTLLAANPIVLVIAGIVAAVSALAAALTYAYNNCETFRNVCQTVFGAIQTIIVNPIRMAIILITNIFNQLWPIIQQVPSVISGAFSTVLNIMTSPFRTAQSIIQGILFGIRNVINGLGLKLDLKIPHISVSAGSAPWGIGGKGTPPSFSVTWHRDAMQNGMLFTDPTIFGMAGGQLQGAGEAGPELLIGRDPLMNMISDAIGEGATSNNINVTMYVDGAENPEVWAQNFSDELTRLVRMGG